MATHYPYYPAPHGWAPPYQGAAPPMPAGVSIPAAQWSMGTWAFNPAYNAQRYPQPQQQWMPGRAWHHAYQQHILRQQQQQQQAANFNPFKKVIKPPSAEYLATRLTNNGLDLHNMVPIEDPHGDAEDPNVPKTPWIWNPATLQNDAPSLSAQRKALAEASNRAAGAASLSRQASEPAVSNDLQLATPRPRHHATDPQNQAREREQQPDEVTEGFTTKGELKPTFSPNVVRAHHSRSSTSSSRQSSISSASNSTSSQPLSRHASMPSIYSSQPATKSSSSVIAGTALTDEPISILSPLSAILMVPEDDEPDPVDSDPTPRLAELTLGRGATYSSFSSIAEASNDRTSTSSNNTHNHHNIPYNHTTASQSVPRRRQASRIYAPRSDTPRAPVQDTHTYADTHTPPSSSTRSQYPSRAESQDQGHERDRERERDRDHDRERDRDRSSYQQQQQHTPPESASDAHYPARRPSSSSIYAYSRPKKDANANTTSAAEYPPYPISSNPHYNVSPSGTTPGYKAALSTKPLSGVSLLPKPPPAGTSTDPYTSTSTNPYYNIDVDDDMRHIPPEVMERREREFAATLAKREREKKEKENALNPLPALPAIIPMPSLSGQPDTFSYSSSYGSASAAPSSSSSSSFPRTPTRGHSYTSATSSSSSHVPPPISPRPHEEPRPTPIKLKNVYTPIVRINPKLPYRVGYWNKRGDHVTKEGFLVFAPPGETYPPELAAYPEEGNGYKDEFGFIGAWDALRPELPESLPKYGMPPKQPYRSFIDLRQ